MSFDSTKPANGSPVLSVELRNQLNALNDDIQQRALSIDVSDSIIAQSSGPVNSLPPPNFTVSNPPTQAEILAITDYMMQLYVALTRT